MDIYQRSIDEAERGLECSSLFMAAELLDKKPEQFGYVRIHAEHISRIRAVATRMSLELEEIRLRRSIENAEQRRFERDPQGLEPLLRQICSDAELARMEIPVTDERVDSSLPPATNDYSLMKRYLELDKCRER